MTSTRTSPRCLGFWQTLRPLRTAALASLMATGCLDLLGLDGDYRVGGPSGRDGGFDAAFAGSAGSSGGSSGDGATSHGGMSGSGGMPMPASGGSASGGVAGDSGASGGTGGVDAGDTCGSCAPNQKCCQGICVEPAPFVGCSMEDFQCNPCPDPPANSDPTCTGEECTYQCWPGFEDTGSECVPGAGGSGGTDAAVPMCDPANCQPCLFLGPIRCCRDNGECGCSYVRDAYCFPR